MSSTYSPLLRIELIGTGDQPGTWGDTTNTNLGSLIEQAIAGTATFSVTTGDVTLSALNGSSDQSRCMALLVTGSAGVSRNIVAPATSKIYVVSNTADAAVVLKTAASTGLTIPSGITQFAYYNGTDFIAVSQPYDVDLKALADLATTGIIVRSGSGTVVTRSIAVSGTGLAVTNADGVSGNPTIASNATSANTASTVVARDASGDFSAGTITAVTQFSGPGTGLTGVAAALSIGGNASTSTNATNATNATNLVAGGTIASTVTATTQSANTNNTTVATTAFVNTAVNSAFPSGTRLLFAQAAAPTGWTQITTDEANNRMLRVVNSAGAGTGGSNTPILMDVVPSHTHTYSGTSSGQSQGHTHGVSGTSSSMSANASHSHGITDPGHSHALGPTGPSGGLSYQCVSPASINYGSSIGNTFGSTTGITGTQSVNIDHTHTFSTTSGSNSVDHTHTYSGTSAANAGAANWAPRYLDTIICSKN